jgi:hypothetical protein
MATPKIYLANRNLAIKRLKEADDVSSIIFWAEGVVFWHSQYNLERQRSIRRKKGK